MLKKNPHRGKFEHRKNTGFKNLPTTESYPPRWKIEKQNIYLRWSFSLDGVTKCNFEMMDSQLTKINHSGGKDFLLIIIFGE